MDKRGKFIVFEGGEGSGKSAHMERLKSVLPKEVVFTRNPGGVAVGEKIRALVLSKESAGIDARAELLLFLAARAQLIAEVIRPALESGRHVICDRFSLSTLVYQVYGRQKPEDLPLLTTVSDIINAKCVPDATIFLDVSPSIGLKRAHSRSEEPNRFDTEEMAFHERVREEYKKHISEYRHSFTIDADRPQEEVWTDVLRAVQSIL